MPQTPPVRQESTKLKKGFLLSGAENAAKSTEKARLKEAEEARRKKEAEDERLRKAAEEERLRKMAEEERLRKEAEEEEERLRKVSEDERLRKEAEEERLRQLAEAERLRKEAEDEERLREAAEEERVAKKAEDDRFSKEEAEVSGETTPGGNGGGLPRMGQPGVKDISPDQDGSLLLKEAPGAPATARSPPDGTRVTIDVEAFDAETLELRMPRRRMVVKSGSGESLLPDELELAMPNLKQGVAAEVLCLPFGRWGPAPQSEDWKDIVGCEGKSLLLRLELVEFDELCLATLSGAERFAYARGRKEAGGRFFKRSRFAAALERYSIAAEMLEYKDDLKAAATETEVKELCLTCEVNAAACLLKLERWREAEAVCSAVLRRHPANEKALFRRAKALLEQDEGGRAQIDLKKLVQLNPSSAEARELMARAKREGRGSEQERAVAQKMLLRKKKDAVVRAH